MEKDGIRLVDWSKFPNISACNFYQHATCVSLIKVRFLKFASLPTLWEYLSDEKIKYHEKKISDMAWVHTRLLRLKFVIFKYIQDEFDVSRPYCLPPCTQTAFHPQGIEYTKLKYQGIKLLEATKNTSDHLGKQTNAFWKVSSNFSSPLAAISTTIQIADMMGIYYEERPDYLFNELVADVGGSLGVILGLSLVDILIFGRRFTNGFWPLCSEIFKKYERNKEKSNSKEFWFAIQCAEKILEKKFANSLIIFHQV